MAKWLIFVSILSAAVSLNPRTIAATLTVADLSSNDLIITEYLANPVGISDSDGEYFEIFNSTGHLIDLSGLIVRDDGSNSFTVTALTVAAQSFSVFSSSDGASLGITPNYVYGGGMALTNTDDEIGLYKPNGTAIHQLSYDDGDFFGAGIAHELDLLDRTASPVVVGPASGTAFIAATGLLPLGNTGSPGFAGNTTIDSAKVPLPASIWMFGSTLSMLCWLRRKAANAARITLEAITDDQQTCSHAVDGFTAAGPLSFDMGPTNPGPINSG